jgi:molybdopterin-guanine dinucleotide biosynthesis adapter protein
MRPPVISVVGKSGSGKTTLIEKLIPLLESRGLNVGVIKHDAHRFEIDHSGKDSYRHFHAGSHSVSIASAEKLALIKRLDTPMPVDDIVTRYMNDMDLVITEGYKTGDKPKIEVLRTGVNVKPLCSPADNRVAVVTDTDTKTPCPQFHLDDITGVAEFILEYFGMFNKNGEGNQRTDKSFGTNQFINQYVIGFFFCCSLILLAL